MRSILHVIGFALCAISVAAVLLSISGFGILFPIGATLIFAGLFFKTKKQKTVAGDLVGSTPPSFSRPISSSYSGRLGSTGSSRSTTTTTSSSTRRDDTSYYDTSPFAYTSYSSNSSSSDDSCSSSSSYDSSSSSSSDSSSCGGSD